MAGFVGNIYDSRLLLANQFGSIPINIKLYFGNFFPIFLIMLSILIFVVADSFFFSDKKKFLISPIFFLCCYGYGGGILEIFASSNLDDVFFVIFRKIPVTILLYFILLKIFKFYTKQKI